MSDPREKLTNHLTAHGVPMELGIRSTDLSEILRGMDYAMVLGMMPARHAAMLLAKYAADVLEERKCRAWWLMDCIEYGAAKGWKRPKAKMVAGLAYASMDEHMGHGTRCGVCNGTQSRQIGHSFVECPACAGKGFVEYLPEAWCVEIGCTMQDWSRTWEPRVQWARRALQQWEADATDRLYAKLGRY